MKIRALVFVSLLIASSALGGRLPSPADPYRQLSTVNKLPVQLDPAFQFRKKKLLLLGVPQVGSAKLKSSGLLKPGLKDPAVGYEGSYRLWGAVTELDKRARYGHYFDFFWRAKRDAFITVRLEYQQESLRSFTLAREVDYPHAKGSHKTAFAIIGDDFLDYGHILSWRCLLIEKGHIVAETRSFLWK